MANEANAQQSPHQRLQERMPQTSLLECTLYKRLRAPPYGRMIDITGLPFLTGKHRSTRTSEYFFLQLSKRKVEEL